MVEDVRPVTNRDVEKPYVYLSPGQQWWPSVTNALTRAVAGAHLSAEVYQARTLDQLVAGILFQTRMITWSSVPRV